jgi:signal transduction histidine kinase
MGVRVRVSSLRFRLTALATAVVAVVLMGTAVALVAIQQAQLTANLDASLEERADTIAGDLQDELPETPWKTNDEDRAIQLVDPDGRVLAASTNLLGDEALPDALGRSGEQAFATNEDLPVEDDAFRVLSRRINTAGGWAVLHVAENIDDLNEALANLVATLAIALPVVIAVVAALMWWLTGRTLRPVETIRSEVDAISATNSHHRVPVPTHDDEVSRLAGTMNRMLDRLDDAADRQRRFVADAAHEIRTPLTRIRTDVEVDLAQPDRANSTDTNAAVRDEVIGLQALIDDLLHLARSDADRHPMAARAVDLDDIVLSEIRTQRTATDVVIDATGVSAAHLNGDPNQLERAFRNLLSNAVRHSRAMVAVTLIEQNETLELAVEDDGPGVASEHQERIFERFARVDDSRSRTHGGTGLGLAITRDIIEQHGGTVTYDANWTAGARFVVSLPRSP